MKYSACLCCMKVVLISQIFHVCFCWFSGIFMRASFIKRDYCLQKFHTVQIPFLHLPFLVISTLIEILCVCITIADSILHIYVAENGNRIINAILEMTAYSFLTESQNFTSVSSFNYSLSTLSVFFVGYQRKWLSMNTNDDESFDPTFKILPKTFGEGHSNPRSVVGWLVTLREVCSVFTFRVKQYCIHQWHTQ